MTWNFVTLLRENDYSSGSTVALLVAQRSDGVDFYSRMPLGPCGVVSPAVWQVFLEFQTALDKLEEFRTCTCTADVPCAKHAA